MRKSATLIERVILESLAKKERDLKELGEDTGLAESFLKVVLQQMLHKGWLLYNRGHYSLLIEEDLAWVESINDKKSTSIGDQRTYDFHGGDVFQGKPGSFKGSKTKSFRRRREDS